MYFSLMKKEVLYFIIKITVMAAAETAWDLQQWNAYSSARFFTRAELI